ncbi:MAG: multicopper oxidase domain-containing protein [candidate division NC10 bacterium]|nr:multicopper oxidase domain-containing protein [candidate division NC10 bacterium]
MTRSRSRILSVISLQLGLILLPGLAWADLVGQQSTCGTEPKKTVVALTGQEKVVDLAEGVKTEAWTFNGITPGPTIEVCEGDTVRIVLKNEGKVAHGLDSHAFRINATKFGPVEPGETLVYEKKVNAPGVFMYHCANGPLTDQHIKMGMYGVMIVYPRGQKLRPAREIVVSENGVYGEPDPKGMIAPSTERMDENRAYFVLYNGTLKHEPLEMKAGDLLRVYFVNAGPYTSTFHVIGAILDRAYEGGNPRNLVYDVQAYAVPAGSGGMFEVTMPEPGNYLIVDHDKLSQLPNGLGIPIVAR